MKLTEKEKVDYLKVIKKELIPAMGCTEPIAIAFAASRAQELLGEQPLHAEVEASGNMIKNVKSVVVPNTNGLKGIEAACIAGLVAGDYLKNLQVISEVSQEQKQIMQELMKKKDFCAVFLSSSSIALYIVVSLWGENHSVSVTVAESHLNIVHEEKDGKVLKDLPLYENVIEKDTFSFMSVEGIYSFADTVDIEDVHDVLSCQIAYNSAIAKEGLTNDWGANVGKTLIAKDPDNIRVKAKAWAAAGSDARMSGCEMPVVINSGSGNQGITVSLPIYIYAKEWNIPEEKMYRALLLANLLGIYQKKHIGRLSAFCGAVSAGFAAGAGICYMAGGDLQAVSDTLTNGMAVSSGIICDGAKASCAGKVAIAVETGLMALDMQNNGQKFCGGDGIVGLDVEKTINNVGRLGKEGMKETDIEILHLMVNE